MGKSFFVYLGKLISLLFSWFNQAIGKIVKAINTGYYIRGMSFVGSNPTVMYPTDRIVGRKYIRLGDRVSIGRRAVLTVWDEVDNHPGLIIGDEVSIGDDCHITVAHSVEIGNSTLFGKKVTISDNAHGLISKESLSIAPLKREIAVKGRVQIGKNVWVGDKVTILGNVTIGDGAGIGANSVVTKDVPAYSVVAGVPAQVLKQL